MPAWMLIVVGSGWLAGLFWCALLLHIDGLAGWWCLFHIRMGKPIGWPCWSHASVCVSCWFSMHGVFSSRHTLLHPRHLTFFGVLGCLLWLVYWVAPFVSMLSRHHRWVSPLASHAGPACRCVLGDSYAGGGDFCIAVPSFIPVVSRLLERRGCLSLCSPTTAMEGDL